MNKERLWSLSEQQWSQIKGAFPQRRGQSGFEAGITNRVVFEAVLFRARTGCAWRDLPDACGDDHTIYVRSNRWVKAGIPQAAMVTWYLEAAKRGELDQSLALADSTIVRAHQHAAGARKKSVAAGRGRRPPRPGARALTWRLEHEDPHGGHEREPRLWRGAHWWAGRGCARGRADALGGTRQREEVKAVGADRAYDSDLIRTLIAAAGKQAVIPPRSNRRRPASYDKEKYKKRNKVERLFCKLKGYRAIATRYDKLATMFLGGVLTALLAISLKCIVNKP